jgi:hypothetical protein
MDMGRNIIIVAVKDAFEIKSNVSGSVHAPGLVVVFDGRQCGYHLPSLGGVVELLRPDGSTSEASVAEIKEHGEGRSFFFGGLKQNDAPIGTVMSWSTEESAEGAERRQFARH